MYLVRMTSLNLLDRLLQVVLYEYLFLQLLLRGFAKLLQLFELIKVVFQDFALHHLSDVTLVLAACHLAQLLLKVHYFLLLVVDHLVCYVVFTLQCCYFI